MKETRFDKVRMAVTEELFYAELRKALFDIMKDEVVAVADMSGVVKKQLLIIEYAVDLIKLGEDKAHGCNLSISEDGLKIKKIIHHKPKEARERFPDLDVQPYLDILKGDLVQMKAPVSIRDMEKFKRHCRETLLTKDNYYGKKSVMALLDHLTKNNAQGS